MKTNNVQSIRIPDTEMKEVQVAHESCRTKPFRSRRKAARTAAVLYNHESEKNLPMAEGICARWGHIVTESRSRSGIRSSTCSPRCSASRKPAFLFVSVAHAHLPPRSTTTTGGHATQRLQTPIPFYRSDTYTSRRLSTKRERKGGGDERKGGRITKCCRPASDPFGQSLVDT
jgi:hypothetical protein